MKKIRRRRKLKAILRLIFLVFGLELVYPIASMAQKSKPDKAISSLISAEKVFEKNLYNKGQKAGFLEILTDNSLIFRPDVIDGISYYQKNTSFKGILNWDPAWVEVSKDGYFGYTTGPYKYMLNDTTYYGDYVSIWIRDPYQTKWKLFVDGGVSHEKPSTPPPSLSYPVIKTEVYPSIYPGLIEQSKDILLSSDVLFATLMSTRSSVKAYEDYLTPDARLLEDGTFPLKGKDSILLKVANQKGSLFFRPLASFVDYSNDMGFTHGTGDFVDFNRKTRKDRKFSYLRIWKLGVDGLWRITLEIRMKKPNPPVKIAPKKLSPED